MWVDEIFTVTHDKNIPNCMTQEEKKYCLASQIKDHGNETIGSVPRG